jgi:hypothetical protein
VIPTHDREFLGKWVDLEMLLCLAARERTAAEYRNLLEQAGLRLTRVVQTASPLSLIEAKSSRRPDRRSPKAVPRERYSVPCDFPIVRSVRLLPIARRLSRNRLGCVSGSVANI